MHKKFRWTVDLADQNGQRTQETVEAFWSPEKDGTVEAIASAGRIKGNRRLNSVFAVVGTPKLIGGGQPV